MPVEQIVRHVCDYKQAYTQYGGLRPFGVAFLFAGYDEHHGFQLYQSDPSGNFSGWKATVIGEYTTYCRNDYIMRLRSIKFNLAHKFKQLFDIATLLLGQNNQAGKSLLKTDYSEENSLGKNVKLAVEILVKTMDATTPSPERIELMTMRLASDGSLVVENVGEKQVNFKF